MQKTKIVTLECSPDFVARIKNLAYMMDTPEHEVLLIAITLLENLVKEDKKGNGISFIPLQKNETT